VGSRRRGRELAVQALYALELNPADGQSSVRQFSGDMKIDYDAVDFAEDLVKGVVANRSVIDRTIEEKSKHWAKSRMPKVDLSILRLATYELLLRDDIPKNVTINEAIEVAKKFGTEESPAFINGILDEIAAALPEKN
jgi:transcription antitermination protein NusB